MLFFYKSFLTKRNIDYFDSVIHFKRIGKLDIFFQKKYYFVEFLQKNYIFQFLYLFLLFFKVNGHLSLFITKYLFPVYGHQEFLFRKKQKAYFQSGWPNNTKWSNPYSWFPDPVLANDFGDGFSTTPPLGIPQVGTRSYASMVRQKRLIHFLWDSKVMCCASIENSYRW